MFFDLHPLIKAFIGTANNMTECRLLVLLTCSTHTIIIIVRRVYWKQDWILTAWLVICPTTWAIFIIVRNFFWKRSIFCFFTIFVQEAAQFHLQQLRPQIAAQQKHPAHNPQQIKQSHHHNTTQSEEHLQFKKGGWWRGYSNSTWAWMCHWSIRMPIKND